MLVGCLVIGTCPIAELSFHLVVLSVQDEWFCLDLTKLKDAIGICVNFVLQNI